MNMVDFLKHSFSTPKKAEPVKKRKKVGIAFGGGGLKGTAHVGMLKVFAEYNIPIDMVAGTSIGSAIAALYGAGYDWQMMKKLFEGLDIESLIKIHPTRRGLIPATGYTEMLRLCTKGLRIEELRIPVKIVAVDLISRKKIIFSSGDTATAVRASSAIPGVFTPVIMGDMVLVDGYVLDNCPGGVVRDMGADVVIACNLAAPRTDMPANMLDVVERSLDIAASAYQKIDADIILEPIEQYMDSLDVNGMRECYERGMKCAYEHIDEILELIK